MKLHGARAANTRKAPLIYVILATRSVLSPL